MSTKENRSDDASKQDKSNDAFKQDRNNNAFKQEKSNDASKQEKSNGTFNQDKSNDAFKINGNWSDQSNQLKKKFSQLTDTDLKFEPGKENELLTRMGNRLSKKREEVIDIIKKGQTA
ncbi:MAG: hypothetical protein ABI199_04770 [Bacteroidia bacterium]